MTMKFEAEALIDLGAEIGAAGAYEALARRASKTGNPELSERFWTLWRDAKREAERQASAYVERFGYLAREGV